jgi:hypothetical protein
MQRVLVSAAHKLMHSPQLTSTSRSRCLLNADPFLARNMPTDGAVGDLPQHSIGLEDEEARLESGRSRRRSFRAFGVAQDIKFHLKASKLLPPLVVGVYLEKWRPIKPHNSCFELINAL